MINETVVTIADILKICKYVRKKREKKGKGKKNGKGKKKFPCLVN